MGLRQADDDFDSKNYKRLSFIFSGFAAVWSVATILWILHVIVHRRQRIPLHAKLSIIPALKTLSLISFVFSFYDCSRQTHYCRPSIEISANSVGVITESFIILSVLHLSKGYCTTRHTLEPAEKKGIVWNVFCLALCQVAKTLSPFFAFPLYVMYIVIITHILSSISLNIRALERQQEQYSANLSRMLNPLEPVDQLQQQQQPMATQPEDDHTRFIINNERDIAAEEEIDMQNTPASRKISLFKILRTSMLVYVGLLLVLELAIVIITVTYSRISGQLFWLEWTCQELLQTVVLIAVGYFWRLRNFDYFIETFSTQPLPMFFADFLPHPTHSEEEPEEEETTRLNLAKPTAYNSISEDQIPVIVVQNPCTRRSHEHRHSAIALNPLVDPPVE